MSMRSLKTKKGAWVKPGQTSGVSSFPGSYADYVYVRAPPAAYPKTAQQRRIGAAGRECAVRGKSGREIHDCIRAKFGK